ncbi:hypothetical protein DYB30_008859 [Aphanomyces astaci]|uniref:Uncharacterized protein n=1 Tax=Aphanomyces astaci TaxID=112090 RepID=A0A397DPP4_APHAT|nr:hypothetical protein DYB30_008859 [Aphanomyces astaci]
MRVHYGFVQVPLKTSMKISPDMTSPALGRMFFPPNPKLDVSAVTECDLFRQAMHSCYLHPEGRTLIVLFTSKAKAARWCGRVLPFRGQPTTLRHYRRPEDPLTHLDTVETEQSLAYSFRLLHVPTNIKALQVWDLLKTLDVDVQSTDQALNLGSGESDVNSFLIVTGSSKAPPTLAGKTRITIGSIKVGIYHFQDHGNMPCRKCAAIDHQVERCTNSTVHSSRIITMPVDMWNNPQICDIHGLTSYSEWRVQVQRYVPPKEMATQTDAMAITHEAGTQATMVVAYGTSTESEAVDCASQTEASSTHLHPTTKEDTFPNNQNGSTPACTWDDPTWTSRFHVPPPTVLTTGREVSPRPWYSASSSSVERTSLPHGTSIATDTSCDTNPAPLPDNQHSPQDWSQRDQLTSPLTEQPTPLGTPLHDSLSSALTPTQPIHQTGAPLPDNSWDNTIGIGQNQSSPTMEMLDIHQAVTPLDRADAPQQTAELAPKPNTGATTAVPTYPTQMGEDQDMVIECPAVPTSADTYMDQDLHTADMRGPLPGTQCSDAARRVSITEHLDQLPTDRAADVDMTGVADTSVHTPAAGERDVEMAGTAEAQAHQSSLEDHSQTNASNHDLNNRDSPTSLPPQRPRSPTTVSRSTLMQEPSHDQTYLTPIDLTTADENHGPSMYYHRGGTIASFLGDRRWFKGRVPARGQCCMHALYCAYATHEWTALSTRSDQVAENILQLKRSIHKMVAGHQALRDLFHTRWLASLTTSGPPTQPTLTEYIHALFARVEAAHPAQGLAPADWGGFPEFAAVSACWNKPVYILQEQPVKDTWWLWVVRYCPGDDQVTKVALPAHDWDAAITQWTADTIVLVHSNGNHFDPLYLRAPKPVLPAESHTAAPPLAAIFLPPQAASAVKQPSHTIAYPGIIHVPNKAKLPVGLAKRIDTWVRHETAELDGMQYESPIRTIEQVEPFLTDFPYRSRAMLWSLGTPDRVISRCSGATITEWGQHLLLSNCYTTMSAVICLTPTELHQHTVEEWKQASIDALTMEEALRVALDPSAWHDHLIPPTDYSGVFNPAFLTALTPPHQLWLAIIAALLDKEGMEEDDLPEKLTLADLHNLAHIDGMLSIIDHLIRGKWGPFWTWIQTNAYAWGYSSTGQRD